MTFLELAEKRYSVRAFSDKPVEEEKLQNILRAARLAPTAKNLQPQKIYVLQSPQALEKINDVCGCIYGAPIVLMVCYDSERAWRNPLEAGVHSGEVDAAIVTAHMMFEACEQGLGSCWVGFFSPSQVSAAFDLPEHVKPVALLPIGYTEKSAAPSERHASRCALKDTVTVL